MIRTGMNGQVANVHRRKWLKRPTKITRLQSLHISLSEQSSQAKHHLAPRFHIQTLFPSTPRAGHRTAPSVPHLLSHTIPTHLVSQWGPPASQTTHLQEISLLVLIQVVTAKISSILGLTSSFRSWKRHTQLVTTLQN